MMNTQTNKRARAQGTPLKKTPRDKVVIVRQVLQEKLSSAIAKGEREFSVDSLLFPADWQSKPLVGLFKGDYGKCAAGLVLRQLMDESGVTYRATWYDKPDDPRGHARLYVLGDEEAAQ